jgi:hypothetical protein
MRRSAATNRSVSQGRLQEWTWIDDVYLVLDGLFKDAIINVLRCHFHRQYIYKDLHDFVREVSREETYLVDQVIDGRIYGFYVAKARGCKLN